MKQLNRHVRCTSLILLYQVSQPFFDLLINGAVLRRFSTNTLKRVELCLQQGGGTLSTYVVIM
jgi:hypothetical protein